MERYALTIPDAAKALGLGLTNTYKLINAGKLERIKLGKRSLIPAHSLQRFIDELTAEHRKRAEELSELGGRIGLAKSRLGEPE